MGLLRFFGANLCKSTHEEQSVAEFQTNIYADDQDHQKSSGIISHLMMGGNRNHAEPQALHFIKPLSATACEGWGRLPGDCLVLGEWKEGDFCRGRLMSLSLARCWVRSDAFFLVNWAAWLDWECWLSIEEDDQKGRNSILSQNLSWPRIVSGQFAYSQLAAKNTL